MMTTMTPRRLLLAYRPRGLTSSSFKSKNVNNTGRRTTTTSKTVDKNHQLEQQQQQQPKACASPADAKLFNAPRVRGRDDDALSRFPHFRNPGGILRGLDYTGTLTFALTGSVTAAQSGLDVFGCSLVGMITAVGGGTIRDAVLLAKQPFWTEETEYIWMTVLTGCLTFFTWPHVLQWQQERRERLAKENKNAALAAKDAENEINKNDMPNENKKVPSLSSYDELDAALDTLDAVGLSAFAIVGAQNGIRAGMPMPVSAICGMATSTFGGLTRDVLCARPVRIGHSNAEIYAAPALLGAITYLVAKKILSASPGARIFSAFFVCMGVRYVAVKHDVKLYTWDTKNDGLGVAVRK